MTEISEVGFVKRIAVGNVDGVVTSDDVQAAMHLLNRCLHEYPRGTILAVEHTPCFHDDAHGRHVFRLVSYHVGFPRRPVWLTD
jgi:hypothetical protein